METKTVNKCLNFVDEVLMDGINDVSTIGKIEFIHNLLIENGGDNTEILSCINLIIEAFYFTKKETQFKSIYQHLRRINLVWFFNCKSCDDNNED